MVSRISRDIQRYTEIFLKAYLRILIWNHWKAVLALPDKLQIISRSARDLQVPQISNQTEQVSNQVPLPEDISGPGLISNQVEQVSNQLPQISDQVSQISNQTAQVSDQMSIISDQLPIVSDQLLIPDDQEAIIDTQVPQVSNQVNQTSNQTW